MTDSRKTYSAMDQDDRANKDLNVSRAENVISPQQYRFTPEESRVLRECNRESFYSRCVPCAGILSVGTYLAIKQGFLKPNPRWGVVPKVMVAVTVGYFIGKISYQTKCAEKMMQLPNSPIGEALRKRKGRGGLQEVLTMDPGFSTSIGLPSFGSSEVYTDEHRPLELDTDRPVTEGLDDYNRPTVDSPIYIEEEPLPPQQAHTTYEELRKKNREEYYQKSMKSRISRSQLEETTPLPPVGRDTQSEIPPIKKKNQYGDVWEN